jgi:hypothetical protein
MSKNIIATMSQVKRQLMNQPQSRQSNNDDSLIQLYCQYASDIIEERTGKKYFVPRREERFYDNNSVVFACNVSSKNDGDTLMLDKEIVEAIEVTTNNGNTIISNSNYFLTTAIGYNEKPYTRISLDRNTLFNWSTFQKAHKVDGIWVNHDDPDNMWKLKTTVQDNPLMIGSTTLNVLDSSLFEVQQLIRFGDDNSGEFAFIEGVNVDANTLTIERGVNGTTAAEQAQATNIYVFKPRGDSVLAAKELAAFLYKNRQNAGGSSDRQIISVDGMILSPLAMLPDVVKLFIGRYRDKL